MTPQRTDEHIDEVRTDTVATEKKLKEKRRVRAAKKTTEPTTATERLIAPILLFITILVSYAIVLFGS